MPRDEHYESQKCDWCGYRNSTVRTVGDRLLCNYCSSEALTCAICGWTGKEPRVSNTHRADGPDIVVCGQCDEILFEECFSCSETYTLALTKFATPSTCQKCYDSAPTN